MLDDNRFHNSFWGVEIVDLTTGVTMYERNRRKSFVPASNMKLYTTAAGLDRLGPDFAWTTTLFADGAVRDDTLHGNLIAVGTGDPAIGGPLSNGDVTRVFQDWADSLRAAGILHVTGDIIGNDDAFDDTPLGPGWMWDDESSWYSAEIGALTFNDNCVDVTVEGGAVGDTATVFWEPHETSYVTVLNQTLTLHPDSSAEIAYNRRRATNVIEVNSHLPAGEAATRSISISNPTMFFTHVLKEALEDAGVTVAGDPVDIDDLFHKPVHPEHQANSTSSRIASYTSPPLSEVAASINKISHNLQAELLLKTLGRRASGVEGQYAIPDLPIVGTTAGGANIVVEFLAGAGVDTSGVVIADGSGLSRYNLITPGATVDILQHMWAHPDTAVAGAFVRSMPIGGVDGTTASLITGGPAVGNLRAKTGTMTGVRSLSGYITTSDGRPLAFSLISNHHTVPTSEVNDVQRMLADLLARL